MRGNNSLSMNTVCLSNFPSPSVSMCFDTRLTRLNFPEPSMSCMYVRISATKRLPSPSNTATAGSLICGSLNTSSSE